MLFLLHGSGEAGRPSREQRLRSIHEVCPTPFSVGVSINKWRLVWFEVPPINNWTVLVRRCLHTQFLDSLLRGQVRVVSH